MSVCGLSALVQGCASFVVSPSPYRCPPLTEEIINEYANLTRLAEPPTSSLRAWVREADKACRANEHLLKDSYQ